MDIARLGIEIDSGDARTAERDLDRLTAASERVEGANDSRAASSRRSTAATNVNTTASRANAEALRAQATAARAVAFRQRMLAFQLNDVFVSLASGMNPAMVAIQQGSQIQQIYGGEGGVASAFRDVVGMASRFARVAGLVGLVATAFVGLQNEINAAGGAQVSFLNVAQATMQETAALIMNVAGPAISWLGDAFDIVAQKIIDLLSLIGNSIVNVFEWAYLSVVALWGGLPAALGDLMFQAAQHVLDGLSGLIQAGINDINTAIRVMNSMLPNGGLEEIGPFNGFNLSNPYEGSASSLSSGLSGVYNGTFENDRLGVFFDRVGERARTLAIASAEVANEIGNVGRAATENAKSIGDLSGQMENANDNLRSYQDIFSGFFKTFNQQIQNGSSLWQAFASAGLSALSQVSAKLIEMATQNLFARAFGSSGKSGLLGGLFGSFGGFFADGGHLGSGQWGIAGERGPEIIHGPANITPMVPMSGAANSNIRPLQTHIYMTVNVDGSMSRAEGAQLVSGMAAQLRSEMGGAAVDAVATVQRRTAVPLG